MKLIISMLLFTASLLTITQAVSAEEADVSIETLKKNEASYNAGNQVGTGTRGPGGMVRNISSNADHEPDAQRKAELEALLAKQKKQLEALKKQNETTGSKQ